MKRAFLAAILLSAFTTSGAFPLLASSSEAMFAAPAVTSAACGNTQKFRSGDFSKLVCLTDIVKKGGFEIIYNGRSYRPKEIALLIFAYIRMNYKNEKAEAWIEKHAHRSPSKGKIIYLKDSQGKMFVLKDVLLQHLKTLPA